MIQSSQTYHDLCTQRGLQLWLRFKDLADDERGQDMVEYALLGDSSRSREAFSFLRSPNCSFMCLAGTSAVSCCKPPRPEKYRC